jgi:hypothetical protein
MVSSQQVLVSSHFWGSWPYIYFCLTGTVLFLWSALSVERIGLYFVYAVGPFQLSLFRVRVPRDPRQYFTLSDLRLPFSSLPTTRWVTVEVFDPASIRANDCWSSMYSLCTHHRENTASIVACPLLADETCSQSCYLAIAFVILVCLHIFYLMMDLYITIYCCRLDSCCFYTKGHRRGSLLETHFRSWVLVGNHLTSLLRYGVLPACFDHNSDLISFGATHNGSEWDYIVKSMNIVTYRLKAGISESERASIARQRLDIHVSATIRAVNTS